MTRARIAGLSVYPVKACRGLDLPRVQVAPTGLATEGVRDRGWMVVDAGGRFVTQREAPELALVRTAVRDGRLSLDVPGTGPVVPEADGPAIGVTVWRSNVRGVDAGHACARALSAHLGREVRMVRFDDALPRPCNPDWVGASGATTLFADGYPVLVIGRASLDDVNARLAAKGFPALPMNRFRPNVVLDGLEPYDEDHLDTITAGEVTLKLVKPCTRCEVTTTDQETAHRNLEPLRTLATYRQNDRAGGVTFGMNAIVVAGAGASLAVGEPVDVAFRF
jgi:uncharacterized protein YcbX